MATSRHYTMYYPEDFRVAAVATFEKAATEQADLRINRSVYLGYVDDILATWPHGESSLNTSLNHQMD
jgi:hypothetical protein